MPRGDSEPGVLILMNSQLKVSIGQYSDKGRKALNQDFHGAFVPQHSQLDLKGVALALADGISSSDVSQIASATAVRSFLEDYYCTSDAWSVRKSVHQVLSATNSWLHTQTRNSQYRYERDKGYVCTFSALVIKSQCVHIFHVGDSRVYRFDGDGLEQLTNDHRLWVSQEQSYLSRALGIEPHCEFDYQCLLTNVGDTFVLATDGVYEFLHARFLTDTIELYSSDLDQAARHLVEEAVAQGSQDNLTIQLVRVDTLPTQGAGEIQHQVEELPLPPVLDARMSFDGYAIIRELHASARSHVFLALDETMEEQVVIKTPSIDLSGDPAYLERFLTEEWIARRISSAYVLKAYQHDRKRNYLYTVFELVEGQTLGQWLIDNPAPGTESMRDMVEQIARGLQAFHRMEMLHQDLKPDNIMIDNNGTVKIIDFGSVVVAGLTETAPHSEQSALQGTALYSAPEYFLGEPGSTRSDIFSLGVIAYYMLSARFPYGTKVAQCKSVAAQRRLAYQSVLDEEREIPVWIDEALRKALQVDPYKRYAEISEFLYDLRHPNREFLRKRRAPLIERNPVAFWQGISFILVVALLATLVGH